MVMISNSMSIPNRTVANLTNNGSILKQIECPSQANGPYSPFQGMGFMLGTAFPEMIGYMFAYNFSGLGSNDSGFFGKMGFLELQDSKRILGYNYFQPMNLPNTAANDRVKCSATSSDCAGEEPYLYIRGYPTSNSGNVSFAIFEDVLDLNPALLINAMFSAVEPGGPKCEKITMPVGSNFNFCGKQPDYTPPPTPGEKTPPATIKGKPLGYQASMEGGNATAITNYINSCSANCTNLYGDEQMPFHLDNCIKDCSRIWWEETRCSLKPVYTEKVSYPLCDSNNTSKSYEIPIGKDNQKSAQNKSSTSVNLTQQIKDPNDTDNDNKDSFQNFYPQRLTERRIFMYRCIGYIVIATILFLIIIVLCICKVYL